MALPPDIALLQTIRQIKTLLTLYTLMIPSLIGMMVVILSVLQHLLGPLHTPILNLQLKQNCTTFI